MPSYLLIVGVPATVKASGVLNVQDWKNPFSIPATLLIGLISFNEFLPLFNVTDNDSLTCLKSLVASTVTAAGKEPVTVTPDVDIYVYV